MTLTGLLYGVEFIYARDRIAVLIPIRSPKDETGTERCLNAPGAEQNNKGLPGKRLIRKKASFCVISGSKGALLKRWKKKKPKDSRRILSRGYLFGFRASRAALKNNARGVDCLT